MYSQKKIFFKISFILSFLLSSFLLSNIFNSTNVSKAALQCQVRNGGCVGGEATLLRMSSLNNAHAGLMGSSLYDEIICCEDGASVVTVSNDCTAPLNDVFLNLSGIDNAHVEKSTESNYGNSVCMSVSAGAIDCSYQSGACVAPSECLASISSDTNAHIGDCDAYPEKVCCDISSPVTCSLALDSSSIPFGTSATLAWVTSGASSVEINSAVEALLSSSKIVTPLTTTTYSLVATDGTNNANCSATLTVLPVCSYFTATPSVIPSGGSSTLKWETDGASSLIVTPPVGITNLDNAVGVVVNPISTTNYILTAQNSAGDITTCFAKVTIETTSPPTPGHMTLTKFDKDIKDVLMDTIEIVLSFVSKLILLFLIIGGTLYVISGSNPDIQEKAKKLITYTLLGAILILLSYAILAAIEKIGAIA